MSCVLPEERSLTVVMQALCD